MVQKTAKRSDRRANVSLDQLDAYREAGDLASDQFRYSTMLRDREADGNYKHGPSVNLLGFIEL